MADIPPPPSGWTPPDDITDTLLSFTWYTDWTGLDPDRAGASTIYDPEKDRVFIEPRPDVFHDEMMRTMVSKSPLPQIPEVLHPAAVQKIDTGEWGSDIPTVAEGLQLVVRDIDGSEIRWSPEETEVAWVYKHVAAMYTVDVPPETTVQVGWHQRGVGNSASVELRDLYRELKFDDKLPRKKVEYDR